MSDNGIHDNSSTVVSSPISSRRSSADKQAILQHDAIERIAHLQRHSSPPRCSPVAFVTLIISFGLTFVGVTMTTVAHWPGATSVGRSPLRIAGPTLLGVGGAVSVCSIVLFVVYGQMERKNWKISMDKTMRKNK